MIPGNWLDPEEITVAHILQNLKYSSSDASSEDSIAYDEEGMFMVQDDDVQEMIDFDTGSNMSESSDEDHPAGELQIDSDVELDIEGDPFDSSYGLTGTKAEDGGFNFDTLPPIMRRPFRASRLKRKVEVDSDDEGAGLGDAAYKPSMKRRPSPRKGTHSTKYTTKKRKPVITNSESPSDPNYLSPKYNRNHRASSAGSDATSLSRSASPPPSRSNGTGTAKAKLSSSPPRHRVCNRCFSDDTPMWRHGPPEWPDLCNKCGVKYMRGRISPEDDDRSDLIGHEREPPSARQP
ncbi:hypothetical protein HDV00_010894 [Rhizophlyctis rosea]|nr:hypothetical protein HDV00_010894 [Rhizophlyctis rosea]